MGDRLTLRDADERRRWAREHDAFLAPRRAGLSVDEDLGARADAWADSRVRAYRERLPGGDDDAPAECEWGHNGNDDGAEPCDVDGVWRTNCGRVFCDEHATMAASAELDAAAWARVRGDGDSGGFNRGPTEGASDAGWSNLHDRALTVALGVERFAEGNGDWGSLDRATERLRESLGPGDAAKGDASTATSRPTADEVPPLGWELCEVGTPADGWYCRQLADADGVFRGTTTKVRGAKSYAVAEARELAESAPAPQVPDSPGPSMTPPTLNTPTGPGWEEVWLEGDWRDVWVSEGDPDETGGRGLYWLNTKTDETDGVDGHFWRGRCTRGAPDDGLRARVEAVMNAYGKTQYIHIKLREALDPS